MKGEKGCSLTANNFIGSPCTDGPTINPLPRFSLVTKFFFNNMKHRLSVHQTMFFLFSLQVQTLG